MALLKIATHWLRYGRRAAKKLRGYTQLLHKTSSFRPLHVLSLCPSVAKCSLEGREAPSIACDFQSTLLTTRSFFPFFMLLAFEGGGLLRAFLLLLSYPLVLVLGHHHHELSLRIMAFISFCGLRKKDVDLVAKAVLPKFFLENLDVRAYHVWASSKGKKLVVTGVPRVMVEWFLKDYLGANEVAGAEMKVVGGGAWSFYTGIIIGGLGVSSKHKAIRDLFGENKPDIGLVSHGNPHDHVFVSSCKQTYIVNKDNSSRATLPREKYPKPLIFHDGRLAFLPMPSSMLALFLWLPIGISLFIIRAAIGHLLPYKLAKHISPISGIRLRVDGLPLDNTDSKQKGVLYVCNHRTLLDPLFVSAAINRPITAVTYSLSPISELISPIKTARLTRDRKRDAEKITKLLKEGDVVVCPEGTTCREPYLLRFSALFAELADNMVPVAVDTSVTMFYGTTASGFKFLDPVFFLMNPRPEYLLRFLGHVPEEMTCASGRTAMEVANGIQKILADALGFECTSLTRKDKYLMLAGNEGVVEKRKSKRS
ncbi:glycerol-3-phosphate acyltransferase 1-like [Phalaenopsis equestris]|uniref:glycerol-3-phosphate acyltransferase 1-like n=1 Tax=Phalaenopsis equestris TaxID=78828 RepID=UPI0009E578E6|nr:glycerol-3-phosphate acyltransferase 1-like [Phalaenopsis equestris]